MKQKSDAPSPLLAVVLAVVLAGTGYVMMLRPPQGENTKLKTQIAKLTGQRGPAVTANKDTAKAAARALAPPSASEMKRQIERAAATAGVRFSSKLVIAQGTTGPTASLRLTGQPSDAATFVALLTKNTLMQPNGQLVGPGPLYLVDGMQISGQQAVMQVVAAPKGASPFPRN